MIPPSQLTDQFATSAKARPDRADWEAVAMRSIPRVDRMS